MNSLLIQRLHARSGLFYLLVGLILFLPMSSQAQKVGFYDYTDVKPAERLRPPLPPPPIRPGELAGGVCGGILSNSLFTVSILSLDRDSYVFGDEFIFVLEIKATQQTRIPVRASLANLEPVDPSVSYTWRTMGITMELHTPEHLAVRIGLLQLYGSKDVPGSEIELKPGEWIELRGKAQMEWSNPPPNTLEPGLENSVIRAPLEQAHQFSAYTLGRRAGSFRYDAQRKQEERLCDYPGEQSYSGPPAQFTVTPRFKR